MSGSRESVLSGELDDPVPALGRADHAADRREIPRREIPGGHAVGGDHEVLDDVLGAVLSFRFEITDLVAVKDRFRLDGFQTQRSLGVPQVLQALRDPVLHAQILRQSGDGRDRLGHGAVPFQPGGHAVIGELRMIADARPVDIRALHGAVRADHHFDDNGQALLIEIQGGEVGGKLLGQHREDLGRRIHRGRVVAGVLVDGRPVLDERVHVGHGHTDLDGVSGQGLGDGELIQVAGVVVVDGSPQKVRQIANPETDLPLTHRSRPRAPGSCPARQGPRPKSRASKPLSRMALWAMPCRMARCCWSVRGVCSMGMTSVRRFCMMLPRQPILQQACQL